MRYLALLALAACTHQDVFARPRTIARHRAELMSKGFARVEVEQGGTFAVDSASRVAIVLPGNQKKHLWGLIKTGKPHKAIEVSIGELAANCDAEGRGPDCLAMKITDEPLRVGSRAKVSGTELAIFLFGAATFITGVTCLSICSEKGTAAWVGTAIGAGVMIQPLTTVF
jgi:hypothetical protein